MTSHAATPAAPLRTAVAPTTPPAPRGDRSRLVRAAVLVVIAIAALGLRLAFLDHHSLDFTAFLDRWYTHIADNGGFAAFSESFADYNYPYLYLIAILTYLHIPALVGIKGISIAFDFVLAFFAYRIVGLRYPTFWPRALVFGLILFLPTVVANSSYWGQADGIYSAFAVGGIYFLLRRRPWLACVFIGLALSFKLQAIFLIPVVAFLVLRRRIPWRSLLAIPAVMLLLDIPPLLFGAPIAEVLGVYVNQTGSYKQLTLGAPNLYQWISLGGTVTWIAYAGVGVVCVLTAAALLYALRHKPELDDTAILLAVATSAVVVPFFLPAMHERYFYMAEVLTVIVAFYLPTRYWIIPILVQIASFGGYYDSLTGDQAGGGFGGRPGGGPGGGGPRPDTGMGGGRPSGGAGGRADGGMGGNRSGGDGYTSGQGDTSLQIYAGVMAMAVLALVATTVTHIRRPGR
ncbi:glycosyltransferase 87 family protein [Williamsia herbipolensis]|uniref:Glycosyltransferase 87 family protein n=1 Tax=Williamsia herbipolensis TaxID=1603258 RepID=A0AAU4K1R3_9NOCA|nr:glycosyltransferase 87 family protein [Williamsia herbipolensis]